MIQNFWENEPSGGKGKEKKPTFTSFIVKSTYVIPENKNRKIAFPIVQQNAVIVCQPVCCIIFIPLAIYEILRNPSE